MAANRPVIEVLHFIGARDRYIAGQFQRHFLWLGLKGGAIGGLDKAGEVPGVTVFHAGTAKKGDGIVANGGRVLNVTATAPTLKDAVARAYEAVDLIDWQDGFCRRDIAWRALDRG